MLFELFWRGNRFSTIPNYWVNTLVWYWSNCHVKTSQIAYKENFSVVKFRALNNLGEASFTDLRVKLLLLAYLPEVMKKQQRIVCLHTSRNYQGLNDNWHAVHYSQYRNALLRSHAETWLRATDTHWTKSERLGDRFYVSLKFKESYLHDFH